MSIRQSQGNAGAAGSGGDGAVLDGVTSSIKATVIDLTNSNPQAVAIVDGSGTQLTSFGGGTQYADGAARGTGTGTIAMVDDGTLIQTMKGDSSGRPQVNIDQVAGANAVSGSGTATGALRVELPTNGTGVIATITTVSTLTGGGVAHDGADSGNPLKIGGRAVSAEIAAVANNDRSDFVTDLVGKQIVLPYANPENFISGVISSAMTGTTSTSLIAAPASGLRNYITQITVSNTHATVGTNLEIQDGNGGATYYIIPAAAVYGGATLTFPTPLKQPTTATAVYVKNTTTGASTFCSASGYKGA